MKKKITLCVFILILCMLLLHNTPLKLNAHTYQVPVIVDTDMALDDARSLILLFNMDMADIRLIVTSDGAVSPETGYRNLVTFCREQKKVIELASGRELHKKNPPWREWSERIFSFAETGVPIKKDSLKPAAEAIVDTLQSTEESCIYLCLGPLTNLADALKLNASIREKISRVIYYGTAPDTAVDDWNTGRDLPSAQRVFRSGLKIMSLSNPVIKSLKFDTEFLEQIGALKTPAANQILKLHGSPVIKKLLADGHFRIWDDIAVIYLNRPDIFRFEQRSANVFVVEQYKAADIYTIYMKLLGFAADSHLPQREVVVLENFPIDPLRFKPDVRPFVEKMIGKHGMEEWKACVLTNELHRHLGIYSLIGAKMGIRAREILEAPLDSLRVVSFAGNKPPLSCFNDGLQVSTGASLGRGTIEIKNSNSSPAAEFIFRDQRLVLRVKEEILRQIKKDIRAAIKKYGDLTPEYFAHIRKLSITYWYDLERSKIFDLER